MNKKNKLLLSFTGFIVLMLIASFGDSGKVEVYIFEYLNSTDLGIDRGLNILMFFGGIGGILSISAFVCIFNKELSLRLLAGGIFVWFLSYLVKNLIARPRPSSIEGLELVIRSDDILGHGFPSTHAAVICFVSILLLPYLDKKMKFLIILSAAVISLGRIYLGVHMPIDVAGGVLLGSSFGLALRRQDSCLMHRSLKKKSVSKDGSS